MQLPPSSYPMLGAGFFMGHPSLWIKIICPLLLTVVGGLIALIFSFSFLLPLQANALINANCPAWAAWLVSVIFVLIESAILTMILFAILLPIFMDALFDATIRLRGLGRVLEDESAGCFISCCRGMGAGVIIVVLQILLLIITIPLHFLPVAGTIAYCVLNGWILTWSHHIHYDIEIRHWGIKESRRHAWRRRNDYVSYGAIAVALELVPFANLLFMWTNVCGVALWIADEIEDAERNLAVVPSPEQPLVRAEEHIGYGSSPFVVPKPRNGWGKVAAVFVGVSG